MLRSDALEEPWDRAGSADPSPEWREASPDMSPERCSSRTPLMCWKLPGPRKLPRQDPPRHGRLRPRDLWTCLLALTDALARALLAAIRSGRRERDLGLPIRRRVAHGFHSTPRFEISQSDFLRNRTGNSPVCAEGPSARSGRLADSPRGTARPSIGSPDHVISLHCDAVAEIGQAPLRCSAER